MAATPQGGGAGAMQKAMQMGAELENRIYSVSDFLCHACSGTQAGSCALCVIQCGW